MQAMYAGAGLFSPCNEVERGYSCCRGCSCVNPRSEFRSELITSSSIQTEPYPQTREISCPSSSRWRAWPPSWAPRSWQPREGFSRQSLCTGLALRCRRCRRSRRSRTPSTYRGGQRSSSAAHHGRRSSPAPRSRARHWRLQAKRPTRQPRRVCTVGPPGKGSSSATRPRHASTRFEPASCGQHGVRTPATMLSSHPLRYSGARETAQPVPQQYRHPTERSGDPVREPRPQARAGDAGCGE